MKSYLKKVKSFDIFVHPILLHLDEQGEAHKTIFGGFVSIFHNLFTIAYFSFCLYKMIAHLQDQNMTAVSF